MDAIIVDMDGTLCDVAGVRHYVTGDSRNFHAFHEASRFCPTRPEVEHVVREIAAMGVAIVIVTARDARHERVTRDWLARESIPYARLYMRPWGDQRRDTVVKSKIFYQMVADGFSPIHAIDDREDIAQVWESHGIPVTLVSQDDSPG